MKRNLFPLGCLVLAMLSFPSANISAQEGSLNPAAQELRALFASEWDYSMEQYPTWASTLGDRRWNDRWEDRSLEAIGKRHGHNREILKKLASIDRGALSAADRLNYDLFVKDYERRVEGHRYRWHLIPLNQRGGIQTADELGDALRFQTVKDYEDWLGRLRAFPVYMEQTIALMREGIKARMLLPKIVLQRVPAQIDHQLVGDPKASPFYKPFARFTAEISQADR